MGERWVDPTHETIVDDLRDPITGAWKGRGIPCRKRIKCKSNCMSGCDASWTPDDEYVYGIVEWENALLPYCKIKETGLELAKKRCSLKDALLACEDQCPCE